MTNTTQRSIPGTEHIVFRARVGSEHITLTVIQLRDTVAAYLAKGGHLPTPRDSYLGDPHEPLHIIVEEWLWGNVIGWVTSADVLHVTRYRHQAMGWIRSYFGDMLAELDN